MFSLFKRSSLKTALESCQQRNSGTRQELTPQQFEVILSMPSFEKVDRLYKKEGLTNWGGLAWFSAQFIENILKSMDQDNDFDIYKDRIELGGSIYEMINKVASISCLIYDNIPGLKLTRNDMVPIERAAIVSNNWLNQLDKSENPAEKELRGMDF